jgi:2-keto-4-pentenoate hydratase
MPSRLDGMPTISIGSGSMADEIVRILVEARRTGTLIDALPDGSVPADLEEAHAVQMVTAAALGETIAGWKVAITKDGEVMRAPLFGSRMFSSPAEIPASLTPLLGIEVEIAFRFERALVPRAGQYGADEVASAVTALAAIEVVDSRFRNRSEVPALALTADCMTNGAFVAGTMRSDWRSFDLSGLEASLIVNGEVVVQRVGGHSEIDPLRPAVRLANALRTSCGVAAGQIVTTGTCTGLTIVKPGDRVVGCFAGFGEAEVCFRANA